MDGWMGARATEFQFLTHPKFMTIPKEMGEVSYLVRGVFFCCCCFPKRLQIARDSISGRDGVVRGVWVWEMGNGFGKWEGEGKGLVGWLLNSRVRYLLRLVQFN
jgi:hypothetical protein